VRAPENKVAVARINARNFIWRLEISTMPELFLNDENEVVVGSAFK